MLCCLSWSVVSSTVGDDGHGDDDDDSGVDDDHPT